MNEPFEPYEPQRSRILAALIAEVKPDGGVWCEGITLRIRYSPFGSPMRIKWAEAAILTGVEVPEMQQRIKKLIKAAQSRNSRKLKDLNALPRKPVQRSKYATNGTLTLEIIAEAKAEARRWHERENGHLSGLGSMSA